MTLNQILYFQKVARLENYHQAAEELYISQPSLSRSMASLESELGVVLFEKKGRGVSLTKAGRYFLEHADRIMEVYQAAVDDMHTLATGGGKIDIGYVFPLAGYYIPHKVKQFLNREENRDVIFSFFQNHTASITKRIRKGELDVGFGGYSAREEMEFFPMFSQEIVLITPKDHPLSALGAAPLSCLTEYPIIGYDRTSWMGTYTRAFYRKYGLDTNIIVECPDEYSILSLVRENFGIALITYVDFLTETDGIVIHRLDGLNLYHQTFMFWVRDRYRTPAVNRFIEYMKEQARPETDSGNALKIYLKDIVDF